MNASGSLTDLEGCLDRITFYNPENHYTIAKFRPRGAQNAISVVGFMTEPAAGEFLKLDGIWETHARYGQQLKILRFEVLLPPERRAPPSPLQAKQALPNLWPLSAAFRGI